MEVDFLEMMPDRVTWVPFLQQNFDGEDVYDEDNPRVYQCRIVGKGLSLRRTQGEEDTIIVDIYIDPGSDVLNLADKIILPEDGAWIDRTPEIFAIGRYTDEDGQHHAKVQCGWMYHRQGQ